VGELRPRPLKLPANSGPGGEKSVESNLSQGEHNPQTSKGLKLSKEEWAAGFDLSSAGLVTGGCTTHGRADISITKFEAVVPGY